MMEVGCRGRTSFSGPVDSVNTGCVVAEGEEVCDRGFPVPYRSTSSWAMCASCWQKSLVPVIR